MYIIWHRKIKSSTNFMKQRLNFFVLMCHNEVAWLMAIRSDVRIYWNLCYTLFGCTEKKCMCNPLMMYCSIWTFCYNLNSSIDQLVFANHAFCTFTGRSNINNVLLIVHCWNMSKGNTIWGNLRQAYSTQIWKISACT